MSALALLVRRCAAVATTGALVAALGVTTTAAPALASTTGNGGVVVGWQADANDLGTLTFYDANGHQITSGSTNDAPMAAYYVSNATGKTQGFVAYTTPVNGQNSATWAGTQTITSTQTFPASNLPGDLAGFGGAVVKGAASDLSFADNQIANFPNGDTSSSDGYGNLYEVRQYVNGSNSTWYAADIVVNTSTNTWTQVFPNQTAPTITVGSTEPSPQPQGTVHLTATLGTALPGTVQFFDGSTALGSPVAVSGTTAATTDTPALGAHSYTATFVPTPGSTGLGATSAAYPFTVSNPTAPAAPSALSASPSSQTLALTWAAPADGGSAITGYTVSYTPSGGALVSVATGSASPGYTLTGLTNGTSYSVTVSATNAIGTGPDSTAVNATPNPLPPGAPTSVTAVAGNGTATVSFAAPASDGGSPVTGYTVTASTGQVVTGGSSPIVVTGLSNGTSRTFVVTATNAVGTGPASGASNAVVYYSSALSIHATAGIVTYGSTVRLYGGLTSGPARVVRLVLYAHQAGHATTATALSTSSAGAWSIYVRPAYNTVYQVVYGGDATHASVTSAQLRVLTRTRVLITSPRSGTRTTARTLTVTGTTGPNKYNSLVYLYELHGTTWVRLSSARVSSRGTFGFRRTFTKGTHVLQVRIGASTVNAAGASGRCSLYEV